MDTVNVTASDILEELIIPELAIPGFGNFMYIWRGSYYAIKLFGHFDFYVRLEIAVNDAIVYIGNNKTAILVADPDFKSKLKSLVVNEFVDIIDDCKNDLSKLQALIKKVS